MNAPDLDPVRAIVAKDHGLVSVSVVRADGTPHSSLVNAGVLDLLRQFLPTLFAVLLHDRGDQDVVRIVLFHLPELFQPNVDWTIRDQFDVLKADHFAVVARAEFAVARHHVDDLARLEADSLGYRAAPAGIVSLRKHARVSSRRA